MRCVALDHFLARDVVKERKIIYAKKKRDWIYMREEFYAFKIQQSWRATKEVSKTRLKIQLHKK